MWYVRTGIPISYTCSWRDFGFTNNTRYDTLFQRLKYKITKPWHWYQKPRTRNTVFSIDPNETVISQVRLFLLKFSYGWRNKKITALKQQFVTWTVMKALLMLSPLLNALRSYIALCFILTVLILSPTHIKGKTLFYPSIFTLSRCIIIHFHKIQNLNLPVPVSLCSTKSVHQSDLTEI